MNSNIKANVSVMFETIEPWDVSNSVANLGPRCAELTWENAMRIAFRHEEWLTSDVDNTACAMCDWAVSTGAWEREETDDWNTYQCLALFVQNIASEVRNLTDDKNDLADCLGYDYENDENQENVGYYHIVGDAVHVDYYAGV